MIEIFIGIGLIIFLVSIGFYLLLHKKRANPEQEIKNPKWFKNISVEARNVHTKELHKKTHTKFTLNWFLEYWQGERSAFYAWFTWLFIGQVIIAVIGIVLLVIFLKPTNLADLNIPISVRILFILYSLMGSIILWRCAKNSTRGFKYFARAIAILYLIH